MHLVCTLLSIPTFCCAPFFLFFSLSTPPFPSQVSFLKFPSFRVLRSTLSSREKATWRGWVLGTVLDGVAPQENFRVNGIWHLNLHAKVPGQADAMVERIGSSWDLPHGHAEPMAPVSGGRERLSRIPPCKFLSTIHFEMITDRLKLEEGRKTPTPKTRFSIWTLLRTPGRLTTRPLPVHFTTSVRSKAVFGL